MATCALLSWGALAFGGVYTWSWIPLLAGSAALGAAGSWSGFCGGTLPRRLAWAIAALVVAVLLQLVPLPARLLDIVSPGTSRFLLEYDVAYALARTGAVPLRGSTAGAPFHPLSIDPPLTLAGLAFLASFGLLFLGLASVLTRRRARAIANGVLVLGLLLACIGLAQRAAGNELIYGFWRPYTVGDPFGPFVNKNHFAGWMLMALPLCLGAFGERLAFTTRPIDPRWRHRMAWCASRDACALVLSALALFVMMVSVLLTMSRSALVSMAVALPLLTLFASRDLKGTRYVLAVVCFGALFAGPVAWVGVDAIGDRFDASFRLDLVERITAWQDAAGVVRDFALTGTGLNTYRTAAILYQSPELVLRYSAAHSDYLQLAAEGGLLLGVPVAALFAIFVHVARARFRQTDSGFWLRAGAVTALVAIGLQELVEFSLQIPANGLLFLVVAAIAIHPPAPIDPSATNPRRRAR